MERTVVKSDEKIATYFAVKLISHTALRTNLPRFDFVLESQTSRKLASRISRYSTRSSVGNGSGIKSLRLVSLGSSQAANIGSAFHEIPEINKDKEFTSRCRVVEIQGSNNVGKEGYLFSALLRQQHGIRYSKSSTLSTSVFAPITFMKSAENRNGK